MELALVMARALQFGSAIILLGAPTLRLVLGSALVSASGAREEIDHWLRRLMAAAAIVALSSALFWLDLEAVIMGDGWDQAVDGETIASVLLLTTFGHAWIWHLAFAVLLLLALLLPPRQLGRRRTAAIAGLSAGLVASLAWAGHAVMQPGMMRVTVQVIHLLAAGLWLGSLPVLLFLLGRARQNDDRIWRDALRQLLPRYSRVGYVVVATILLTGSLNTSFLVGSPAALVTTEFGQVLLLKVGIVLLMVVVAGVNRLRLVPEIRGRGTREDVESSLAALARNVVVEQALGALAVVAVSVLGTLPPALAP